MKKSIILSGACICLGLQAFGQRGTIAVPRLPSDKLHKSLHLEFDRLRPFNPSYNKAPEFRWLNYGLQLDTYYSPGMAAFNFMHNFPDSTIVLGLTSSGEVVYPWIHKTATILDPKNMPDPWITPTTSYTLDSIGFAYAYLRSLPPSVIDSVIVEIIKHDDALVYTGIGGQYIWQDIEYDYTTNSIKPYQVIKRIAIPLTENDTTSIAAEILLPVTGVPVQQGNRRIGAVISFKPGFTWTITDSLFQKNVFFQVSMEQNGDNTDPSFYGTPNDPNSDLNCSFILPPSVRYNFNTNGWNGYLIPTWAFVTAFPFEHHLIYFGLTADLASVKTEDPAVELFNALPVPADQTLTLNIQMARASSASVRISDLTGRTLSSSNIGLLTPGFQSLQIPVASLATGHYLLWLQTESGITARKIIVKH